MTNILNFISAIGRQFISIFEKIGSNVLFILTVFSHIFRKPFYFSNFLKQFKEIFFFSIPIVGLTSLFTGMVLALQSYLGFGVLGGENAVASIVILSLTRELAPVLTALMVSGRVVSSIAAEIGTMRISQQIDALYTMKVHPIKFLIVPRILAGLLSMPLLVFLADIMGILGGYLASISKLGFDSVYYIQCTVDKLSYDDVYSGLVKAAVFGFIITSLGCYFGYNTKNGADGVGKSTTNSVVVSCILVFVVDYLLTLMFFK